MASTMDPRRFAVAQASVRAAVNEQLAGSIAAVEAERGTRLGQLDQEALANALVLQAVDRYSRSCLDEGHPVPSPEEEDRLGRAVLDDLLTPSSVLQALMSDPTVMSIRVNDYKTTWIVYVDGRKERGPALANDEGGLIQIMRGLAEDCGRTDGIERRIDFGNPKLDGGLPHGDRVFGTVSVSKPSFVIRRHNFLDLVHLEDLQSGGMLSPIEVNLLRSLVLAKYNLVVSGGMKSGKTTLLRVLINTVPPWERKVVLEDTPELGLDRFPDLHPDAVSYSPRGANVDGAGAVTMAELGDWLLRAEPDRMFVGEARGGGEIMALLTAMTCGNEGSMTSVHANSPPEALKKLVLLCARSSERLPLSQATELVASAVDFVVQLKAVTHSGGIRRYIPSIRQLVPRDATFEGISTAEVWRRNRDGSGGPCGGFDPDTQERLEEVGFDPTPWVNL
jgi:pilus assembly protein CpaF